MAADFQKTFRRYGRFYKNSRKYMQRKEVLVSTNVILTFFTVSFFAAFAIRPTALTISGLWREIQDKKTVLVQIEEKISELQEAQTALSSVEHDLALLDAAIPQNVEFSRLVRTLEYLASTHGLLLASSRFSDIELYQSEKSATASATQVKVHPFTVTLKGTFSDIRSFIRDLERLDRMTSVTAFAVRPSRKQEREGLLDLEIGIDSEAFSYPEGDVR